MGLTPTGYERRRLDEILAEIQADFEDKFGEMNWNADSVISQIAGIMAERESLLEEKTEDVYLSQYRASAEGTSLDQVAALIGLTRLGSTYTNVFAAMRGTQGANIPAGTIFSVEGTGERFTTNELIYIGKGNTTLIRIWFKDAVSPGATYRISIDGTNYDHVQVGAEDAQDIAEDIRDQINAGAQPVTASTESYAPVGWYLWLTADDEETNFDMDYLPANPVYMLVNQIWTSILCTAENPGEVLALATTLNTIVTPVGGLSEVNNPTEGNTGREVETDTELRDRMVEQIATVGASTVESIRSQILQNVDGVTSCRVYENETTSLDQIVITFDADFVTGNSIAWTYNGVAQAAIPFNADSDTTQQDLATAIAAKAEVATAVIVGTPTRTITITPVDSEYVIINSIQVTGGASQPAATIVGDSRPAKSIEVVVEGGLSADIAEQLWESKPAGIQTHGFIAQTIQDSMGISHSMEFTRPFDLEYYLHIEMTYNTEETFTTNGQVQIRNDVLEMATQEVGEDVILQKFIEAIFQTPGVATASLTWDLTGGGGPYANSNNIVVSDSQIAKLTLGRITTNIS